MAEDDARTTLSLLESRLHRIEFLLNGSSDTAEIPPSNAKPRHNETVAGCMAQLEEGLQRLSSKSTLVQDVLRLSSRYPDLFASSTDVTRSRSTDKSTLASIVLAHASVFPETASRLSSLKTLPIPDAIVSAHLIDLQSRIDKALEVQQVQEAEVAELKARSANLLERWVHVGVIGMGECWADWEQRARECEKKTASVEARRARDDAT